LFLIDLMQGKSATQLRILISPLNWGLGHASRLIPLIRSYRSRGYKIFLGGNGPSLEMLMKEFPDLEIVSIPFTEIKYSPGINQIVHFIFALYRYSFALRREHKILNTIIREKKIDVVISDNRLGLYTKKAKCIILTHQVWLQMPKGWNLLRIMANHVNHLFIRKFDECWIVDTDKPPNLAGELSHPPLEGITVRYIGPISRFAGNKVASAGKIEILIILGGPEPQRSILEKILIQQISETTYHAVIAAGTFNSQVEAMPPNILYIPFADSKQLAELIQNAEIIICRSGYSSIIDLVALDHSAILIPTPGQPEQEYLGEYLSARRYFLNYRQSEFDLKKAIEDWKKFKSRIPEFKFNQFPH
jgi:uncharacterized protein (TIGR00661 family)